MDATMLILQQRFAMYILLRVYEKPGIYKKEAVDEDAGAMGAKYETLAKLIDAGLIVEDEKKYVHNKKPLFLTETGLKVAEHLKSIHEILPSSECTSREYK
jgi:hypothetical protein